MTVGVIIPDISNHYYAEIVRGVQEKTDREGYNIILQNTDRSQKLVVRSINLMREKVVDGIIFSGGIIDGYEPLSVLREFSERVVMIGRHDVNFPAVMVDNISGATQAVQHLIDLGHDRIRFIGWANESTTAAESLSGYKSALAQNRCRFDEGLVREGELTPQSGYAEAKKLLSREHPPTAIFAANDQMAFGVIHAAMELGFRVPEDLSVVGFDDIPLSSFFVPPLTTVRIPMFLLDTSSMRALIDLISGKNLRESNYERPR